MKTIDQITKLLKEAPPGDFPSMEELEKAAVVGALAHADDKRAAARLLGIGKTTFHRWMQRFDIP